MSNFGEPELKPKFTVLNWRSGVQWGLQVLESICNKVGCVVHSDMVYNIVETSIWNTVSFLLSPPSLLIFLWPLTETRYFYPHNCFLLGIFSFLNHRLEMVECNLTSKSIISEPLQPSCRAPTIRHIQSQLNSLYFPFWCPVWTSTNRHHDTCLQTTSFYLVVDWVAICVNKHLNRCT